jgi:hypothetical protein
MDDNDLFAIFVNDVLAETIREATDAEFSQLERVFSAQTTKLDSLHMCTVLNNAAFVWLERARASGRVGITDAALRAHRLNAFFNVNFNE